MDTLTNETVLLSTQNMLMLMDKTILIILRFFFQPKHVVGKQKNLLNERVLLSSQNLC